MENHQIEKSKVQKLEDAIGYMDNSTVSRQIIKIPSGNITLFAFDEGEGLSEHSAPFDAFIQIIDGSVEITIGGVKHNLISGDFIIMPANIPHALMATKKFKMLLVMIKS